MVAGERKARVIAMPQPEPVHLEIDGVAHVVRRDDGVVVRTGWPALIGSLLVAEGDRWSPDSRSPRSSR